MADFASVFDEAGDSAERAQADRAMAVAKEASAGIAGFLFQAQSPDDLGHRIALAEDDLLKAAAQGGISVHALVAEHTRSFDLLMEARHTTAGEKNVWGTDKDDVDDEGYCPDCERENSASGARQHYNNCPQSSKNKGKKAAKTTDEEHAGLNDAWDKSFSDLNAAGLEADADHPTAKAYRDASDAVNHSNRSRDFDIATGKTSVARPQTCPTCQGARAVPAQGHEPYHEVSNGQVRCPDCSGHGQVQPGHSLYPGVDNPNELTSNERYGDTKRDNYYGKDPGDEQDAWYHDATRHVASIRTALEEGQDPLLWLEQEGGGEGQAEKPSEAGIEATHEATKAGVPPFSRDAGYYDRENLSPGEYYTSDKYTGGQEPHIDETGPHPRVHTFGTTGQAYDASQTNDAIKDGDILHVPSEGVTGFLNQAWPVALHHSGQGEKPQGEFHGMLPGVDPHDIFGGGPMGKQHDMPDYSETLAKAKAVHEASQGKQAAVVPPF